MKNSSTTEISYLTICANTAKTSKFSLLKYSFSYYTNSMSSFDEFEDNIDFDAEEEISFEDDDESEDFEGSDEFGNFENESKLEEFESLEDYQEWEEEETAVDSNDWGDSINDMEADDWQEQYHVDDDVKEDETVVNDEDLPGMEDDYFDEEM